MNVFHYEECKTYMTTDSLGNVNNSDSSGKSSVVRRLLVLDTALPLEAIRERKLESSITCRDLDDFFKHVWSVHPFASLVTSERWASKYGKPEYHELNPSHTFIEGKVGRSIALKCLLPLNFLISQIGLFVDLARLIRKQEVNVIRAGDPLYLGLFGWALSRLHGIPFGIRVAANYDKTFESTGQLAMKSIFLNRHIEKIVERFVLKRADFVVAGNQDNLNFALANGARPEFSTLFRYGNLIDKRHFVNPGDRPDGNSLLKELGVEQKKFLLYIGRLEKVKQSEHVIRGLAGVRKRGYDLKAVLVGDGSLRESLMRLARELEVEDQVVFCGNRDQEWLSRVIPLAFAIVSPHTGRALSEAALGGVPIVAYDIDWQGELIQTAVTGELVPNLACERMVDALERFLKDPKYAHSMGEAARNFAMEMMDHAKLDQHERETYLTLWDRFWAQKI
jgi:glycosyltransferase involved in cell wall biosynthesis